MRGIRVLGVSTSAGVSNTRPDVFLRGMVSSSRFTLEHRVIVIKRFVNQGMFYTTVYMPFFSLIPLKDHGCWVNLCLAHFQSEDNGYPVMDETDAIRCLPCEDRKGVNGAVCFKLHTCLLVFDRWQSGWQTRIRGSQYGRPM